jgi:hypothetical protein
MTVEVGQAAIVRFPGDVYYGGTLRVALVHAYRKDQALVAKWHSHYGGKRRWARPRWIPASDIARAATRREEAVGMVIDPVPPRVAA